MMAEKTLPWADWEIVRRLGGGSYGTVYEIRRERYGIVERAAMKVISFPKDAEEVEDQRRSGFTDESLVNSYRQQMQRFLDEYRLMLELKGKTNIVSCDDFQTVPHADGIGWDIFIKMELLTPLKKYLAREITPEQTVKLGIDLCKALSLCREKDIIHRDIKPDNILVSDSGDFKLGDFGVAKTAERTMAGTRTGTPNFTAPEVYHNEPYGKSVDIYSLGMVLYWMLNRRALPFLPLPPQMPSPDEMQEALLRRMRGEALPRPVDGSRALQDVVLKACAYRPEDRYATPEELRRALKAVYAADTSAADTIPDAQPSEEPSFPDADATMGNNWEMSGGSDDSYYTETFNTDPTMGTMGTESGASASSGAEQQDADARGKDVYTLVRITSQEAAAGCKVETKDAAGRTISVAIPQGIENGAIVHVKGLGAAGTGGGAPGDLLVRVYVQNAPVGNAEPIHATKPKADIPDDALDAAKKALRARYQQLYDEEGRLLDSIEKKDEPIFNASNARWWFGFLTFLFFVMVAIVLFVGGIVYLDIEGVFAGIISGTIFGYCLNKYIRNRKARKRWMKIHEEMKEIENQLT